MQSAPHTVGMNGRQRFGQLIRETRQDRGFEQQELANRIGVSKSVMSYIETARTKAMPEPELLEQLEKALSLPRARMLEALGYLDPDASGSDEAGLEAIHARLDPHLSILDDDDIDAVVGLAELLARATRRRMASGDASRPQDAQPVEIPPPTRTKQ